MTLQGEDRYKASRRNKNRQHRPLPPPSSPSPQSFTSQALLSEPLEVWAQRQVAKLLPPHPLEPLCRTKDGGRKRGCKSQWSVSNSSAPWTHPHKTWWGMKHSSSHDLSCLLPASCTLRPPLLFWKYGPSPSIIGGLLTVLLPVNLRKFKDVSKRTPAKIYSNTLTGLSGLRDTVC